MFNLNDYLAMKTKNLVIEIIESPEGKRYFILREIVPNQAPVTALVSDDPEEVATFLNETKC